MKRIMLQDGNAFQVTAVLSLGAGLKIDGIASYASYVSQPTVAHVAERLGLPGNPFCYSMF